ncbi:uncharacterized protein RHO25_009221 [Cercospora beticola]|uniref:Heterokaryon incompatibility domain-containing protein n=1 Tax=Cercospora beticola TaxID=122368 RepID=A0ABZ0NYW7_CERBT|nr:hypothetical protein RHO25_009221 [Cercospora beticola]
MQPLQDPEQQIRLLKLLPGQQDEVVALELKTFYRGKEPGYKAIAYTWGDLDNQKEVLIDKAPHLVTVNCHYALWQTRLHYAHSWIWIDSLCINQNDLNEKGYQVKCIGRTFASAHLVLCCIGRDNNDVDTIDEIWPSMLVEKITESQAVNESLGYFGKYLPRPLTNLHSYSAGLVKLRTACQHFCDRRYWKRLWVLPECKLAKRKLMLCGRRKDSTILLENLDVLGPHLLPTMSFHYTLLFSFDGLQRPMNSEGFSFELLTRLGCTDARDRIYGTLSFIKWMENDNFIYPDYTRSALDLARKLLPFAAQHHQELQLLAMLRIDSSHLVLRRLVTDRLTMPSSPRSNITRLVGCERMIQKFVCVVEDCQGQFLCSDAAPHTWAERSLGLEFLDQDLSQASLRGSHELVDRVREAIVDQTMRPLFHDSRAMALLCPGARSGDLLMIADDIGACLILRTTYHHGKYQIVGQGLLLQSYYRLPAYTIGAAKIQTTIDDLLVFWAQDLSLPSTEFSNLGVVGIDHGARLERLWTRIDGEVTIRSAD